MWGEGADNLEYKQKNSNHYEGFRKNHFHQNLKISKLKTLDFFPRVETWQKYHPTPKYASSLIVMIVNNKCQKQGEQRTKPQRQREIPRRRMTKSSGPSAGPFYSVVSSADIKQEAECGVSFTLERWAENHAAWSGQLCNWRQVT